MSAEKYNQAFERERQNSYPAVDDFETRMRHAVDRERLEAAARILACPLKVNPPNWQHGRIVYAAAMERLGRDREGVFLDIGTAKGFSACAMSWAIGDSEAKDKVVSIDVMEPTSLEQRNSVVEFESFKTVYEFVAPFIDQDVDVEFLGRGSKEWLNAAIRRNERVAFAFVDGKHTYEAVSFEIYRISQMQCKGDVIVFDDLQISTVGRAVSELRGYDTTVIKTDPRTYMHAVKR